MRWTTKKKPKPSMNQEQVRPTISEEAAKAGIKLQDSPFLLQLKMIDLTDEDLKLLASISPVIEPYIDQIVDEFYRILMSIPAIKTLIETHSSVDRLQKTLNQHFREMYIGIIDERYIERRVRVAHTHVRIGLEPKWYMAAFQNLQRFVFTIMERENILDLPAIIAVTKIYNFEQQIVLEAYEQRMQLEKERSDQEIKGQLKAKILHLIEDLAAMTEEANTSLAQVDEVVRAVNHSVSFSVKQSQVAQSLSTDGKAILEDLSERIAQAVDQFHGMKEHIQLMAQSSKEIDKILISIKEISDQTQLLSLNAAIEAARAGEYGAGFAVVADEVRVLSARAKETIQRISERMTESHKRSSDVMKSMEQVNKLIAAGHQQSTQTQGKFNDILSYMEQVIRRVNHVEEQMQTLMVSMDDIRSSADKATHSAEILRNTTHEF